MERQSTPEEDTLEKPLSVEECSKDITHNIQELQRLIDRQGNKIGKFSLEVILPIPFEIPTTLQHSKFAQAIAPDGTIKKLHFLKLVKSFIEHEVSPTQVLQIGQTNNVAYQFNAQAKILFQQLLHVIFEMNAETLFHSFHKDKESEIRTFMYQSMIPLHNVFAHNGGYMSLSLSPNVTNVISSPLNFFYHELRSLIVNAFRTLWYSATGIWNKQCDIVSFYDVYLQEMIELVHRNILRVVDPSLVHERQEANNLQGGLNRINDFIKPYLSEQSIQDEKEYSMLVAEDMKKQITYKGSLQQILDIHRAEADLKIKSAFTDAVSYIRTQNIPARDFPMVAMEMALNGKKLYVELISSFEKFDTDIELAPTEYILLRLTKDQEWKDSIKALHKSPTFKNSSEQLKGFHWSPNEQDLLIPLFMNELTLKLDTMLFTGDGSFIGASDGIDILKALSIHPGHRDIAIQLYQHITSLFQMLRMDMDTALSLDTPLLEQTEQATIEDIPTISSHAFESASQQPIAQQSPFFFYKKELYRLLPLRHRFTPSIEAHRKYMLMTNEYLPEGYTLKRMHYRNKNLGWNDALKILQEYFEVSDREHQTGSHGVHSRIGNHRKYTGVILHKTSEVKDTIKNTLSQLGISEDLFWLAVYAQNNSKGALDKQMIIDLQRQYEQSLI